MPATHAPALLSQPGPTGSSDVKHAVPGIMSLELALELALPSTCWDLKSGGSMTGKFKAKKTEPRPKKSRTIAGRTSRKVKLETADAGVAAKRVGLSPSQPHSKSYGR